MSDEDTTTTEEPRAQALAMRAGGKAIMKHGGKTSQCNLKAEPN